MSEFTVYPQALEELARSHRDVDDDCKPELCILRVWPGSIEALEIDDWPEQPTPCD